MTQVSWTGLGDGTWASGADWAGGTAPGPGDDAVVVGPGTGSDVAVTGPGVAGSLTVLDDVGLMGSYGFGTLTVGSGSQAGQLDLLNAAAVGVGGLTLAAGGGVVTVDGTSSLEVGTAGGAAAGTLTVDAGADAAGAGTLSAVGGIVDNGTLEAAGGTLTLLGAVSGSGVVQVDAGATLALAAAGAPSTAAVAFTGPGGTLSLGVTTYFDGTSVASSLTEAGVVSGFAAGDTIVFNGPAITAASYAAGSGGQGTLTLSSGSTVEGTLTLAGSYAGSTFQVAPNGSGASGIVLAAPAGGGGGGGPPSPGTANGDVFAWAGSGSWNTAGNWTDVTTGATPAAVAPGANDLVTVAGPSGSVQTITGPGNAASLTLLGGTALSGTFAAGTLAVGTAAAAGTLVLGAGAALTAGTATVADGTLQVAGAGAALDVSGSLRLGAIRTDASDTSPNLLQVAAGGAVQVGNGLDLAAVTGIVDAVSVDGSSSLEIGTVGGAASGTVVIDAGAVLSGAGTVAAAGGIVNSGTILATGGTLSLTSAVGGSGGLEIDAGSTLSLAGPGAPGMGAISFLGPNGTLALGSATYTANGSVVSGLSAAGTITGFGVGDVINYNGGTALTGVSYQVGTGGAGTGGVGTLTLSGGGAAVGTLTLAGDFSGDTFQVAADPGGGSDVTVVPTPVPVPTSLSLVAGGAPMAAANPAMAPFGVEAVAGQLVSGSGAPVAGQAVSLTGNGVALLTTAPVFTDAQGGFSAVVILPGPGAINLVASGADGAGNIAASAAVSVASQMDAALFGTVAIDPANPATAVYGLYEAILGRAPDPGGFSASLAALNAGFSVDALAGAMVSSAEYTADHGAAAVLGAADFVTALYQEGLGRAPESGGLQNWTDFLGSGATQGQVAAGIGLSAEAIGRLQPAFLAPDSTFVPSASDAAVARLYYGLLGRTPDAGGLGGFEGLLGQGASLADVTTAILGSPEYMATAGMPSNAGFVQALYGNALGRAPEAGQGWVAALDGGASRVSVALGIAESNEAQAHLAPGIEQGFRVL